LRLPPTQAKGEVTHSKFKRPFLIDCIRRVTSRTRCGNSARIWQHVICLAYP
jgi:hypothetical protein